MGRGSNYSGTHEHYLLVDEHHPYFGYFDSELDNDYAWSGLCVAVKESFDTEEWAIPSKASDYFRNSNEIVIDCETEKFIVGRNFSGGLPALFVHPKTYTHISGVEKEYVITKDVQKGFNKLIKSLPADILRQSAGAWCSYPVTKYPM